MNMLLFNWSRFDFHNNQNPKGDLYKTKTNTSRNAPQKLERENRKHNREKTAHHLKGIVEER